jgi:hypothetical protein
MYGSIYSSLWHWLDLIGQLYFMIHWIGGLVGPGTGLDHVEEKNVAHIGT